MMLARVGEPHALRRQPVDVRRPVETAPVTADLRPAQVVGEDKHDIRCAFRQPGKALVKRHPVQARQRRCPNGCGLEERTSVHNRLLRTKTIHGDSQYTI